MDLPCHDGIVEMILPIVLTRLGIVLVLERVDEAKKSLQSKLIIVLQLDNGLRGFLLDD
jgi:hypothetical protein